MLNFIMVLKVSVTLQKLHACIVGTSQTLETDGCPYHSHVYLHCVERVKSFLHLWLVTFLIVLGEFLEEQKRSACHEINFRSPGILLQFNTAIELQYS